MLVEVYRNLNKGGYSIRDRKTKKVLDVVNSVILKNVSFHVQEGGRQRVIKQKQKNVHAFVRGELVNVSRSEVRPKDFGKFNYDPYSFGSFFDTVTGEALSKANYVLLDLKGKFYA